MINHNYISLLDVANTALACVITSLQILNKALKLDLKPMLPSRDFDQAIVKYSQKIQHPPSDDHTTPSF